MRIFYFILLLYFLTISDSEAYIDPGSGSLILQAIIAFIASIFSILYIYWSKFKLFIKKIMSKIKKNIV